MQLLAIAEVKVRRYDFRHHAVSRALSNPQVSPRGRKVILRMDVAQDGTALLPCEPSLHASRRRSAGREAT
jgi:hypothetical protein